MPIFFVSLEMARVELAERLLACQSPSTVSSCGREPQQPRHPAMHGRVGSTQGAAARPVKLFIDDTPAQTMLRIAANARRLKLKHKLRMVVIDYLQLIEPENRRDPRQEQVAQISRRLKFLARSSRFRSSRLAQVNRAGETGRTTSRALGPPRIGFAGAGRRHRDDPAPSRRVR